MKVRKHFKLNECVNTLYQNYCDAYEILLTRKFIELKKRKMSHQ